LQARGVRYIELRSLDINVFEPCGISENALYFLEALLLFCLFDDSPPISESEHEQISRNILDVACKGRKPGLQLLRNGENISLSSWANEIFDRMQGVCDLLDQNSEESIYGNVLSHYKERIVDSEQTPSAQILAQMRENQEGFFHFSLRKSKEHLAYFKNLKLSPAQEQYFRRLSDESVLKQKVIENGDTQSFDSFLADYFSHAMPK
jgi:glutamate--cysteine ligase